MTYQQALDAIDALEPRGWRLGLDRMTEFCQRADLSNHLNGQNEPKFIHVAGTNGKGSTTAFLHSILHAAKIPCGAFFSPYVIEYRERIQANGKLISEQDLADLTSTLLPIAESLSDTEFGGVTKFEFEAAMGFLYWARKRCAWVALEVGLGGRLDATNVVTPACSVIVSIGLDHVSILGDTLAKIATEKAGIIKPDIPVVIGSMSVEPLDVIERIARENRSEIWRFGREIQLTEEPDGYAVRTPKQTHRGLRPGMTGAMQPHNLALALAAIDAANLNIPPDDVLNGAQEAWAPGRFQRLDFNGCSLILDGAHNADAATVLRATIDREYPNTRFHLVTNMISGHEPQPFYEPLLDLLETIDVVPVDFHRAISVEETASHLTQMGAVVRTHKSIEEGLDASCASAHPNALVLVTGSNYLVGAVARRLQEKPGR